MAITNDIRKHFSIFTNLYDVLRVIDPINKKTLIIEENGVKEIEDTCYRFLRKHTLCENCISMRAYYEKGTCVKLELKDEDILLVIATPIDLNDHNYVLEMMKNISKESNFLRTNKEGIYTITQIVHAINEKTIKDELTGTFNKRYINERLAVDINDHLNKKLPLSIIMADIDHFKYVNDTYGHVIGDKVLKDFAEIIRSLMPSSTDWIGRYTGEKFLIVLNSTRVEKAYKVAERIRKQLESTIFKYGDEAVSITSSFGVSGIVDETATVNELIIKVDKYLYEAKKIGRNKTIGQD